MVCTSDQYKYLPSIWIEKGATIGGTQRRIRRGGVVHQAYPAFTGIGLGVLMSKWYPLETFECRRLQQRAEQKKRIEEYKKNE